MKNKKFNILFLIMLFFLITTYLTYSKYQSKTIFSIDDKKISYEYFLRYKEFYKIINSLDYVLDCNIVDEIVKNHIFFKIAKEEGIDVSDKSIDFYFNMHKNDLKIDFEKIEKGFKDEEIFEYFKKPFVVKNLLIEKIKYDSIVIQKERYAFSRKVLNEWDGKTVDKNLLNEFTEYVEQHLEKDDSTEFEKSKKNFSEDDGFYYVFSSNKNILFGYRVYKISSDEYLGEKYQKKFVLKFLYDKDKRAFLLVNKDKLLGKIVEVK
ncbi:MAG: hypothetical protein ABIN39_07215 [candidate division WOR-3 bacterium]